MNGSELHLTIAHLPIVGLGFTILTNIYAMIKKSDELRKFTLWCYVVVGIFAFLAYITGDGAEKMMKTYPGITEDIIEPHERLAIFFFLGVMLMAGVSLLGLILSKKNEKLLKKFSLFLLIFALLPAILAVKTGSTGGKIRHTEIEQGYYNR